MGERAPIAVALDAPDLHTLRAWSAAVAPVVSTLKVGLEVYCRDGAEAVHAARAAAVGAALRADAVRQVLVVALRALDQAGLADRVVRAAAVTAALGNLALWQRRHRFFSFCPTQKYLPTGR